MVLAFLNARTTKSEPKSRLNSKIRLAKGLYDRGWSADDVRQLFRLIDWLMELPDELQGTFRQDLHEFEEERKMPYVTSVERLAKEEGIKLGIEKGETIGARAELLANLALGLESRFKTDGIRLMDEIRGIQDLQRLRAIRDLLWAGKSIQDVRNFLAE